MNYEPTSYWPDRFAKQGPTYVARGGRMQNWRDERHKIGLALAWLIDRPRTILDFGCGPGRFADLLALHGEYTGFDLIPEAAALNPHRTVTQLAGQYDLGVAIQVFQHIPDDATIIDAGRHAKAWLVVDHQPIGRPDAHMHTRGMQRIGALLGMDVKRAYPRPVLGHWAALFA